MCTFYANHVKLLLGSGRVGRGGTWWSIGRRDELGST